MKDSRTFLSLTRSLLIMAAVGVVTTGATYAALQSPNVSLTNNIINTGSADLRISKDNSAFTTPSTAGFTFDGVVPGGAAMPASGNTFYLKNYGSVSLAIKAGISGNPSNLSGIDLAKTYLVFDRTDNSSPPVTIALKTLADSYISGGTSLNDTITAGATATYSVKASMDTDAYAGTTASISGINIVFISTGT